VVHVLPSYKHFGITQGWKLSCDKTKTPWSRSSIETGYNNISLKNLPLDIKTVGVVKVDWWYFSVTFCNALWAIFLNAALHNCTVHCYNHYSTIASVHKSPHVITLASIRPLDYYICRGADGGWGSWHDAPVADVRICFL
jgi:hypothetical protein